VNSIRRRSIINKCYSEFDKEDKKHRYKIKFT